MGEGILNAIADRVGTPVFVYDAAAIRSRFRRLVTAFGDTPHGIYYSVKANSNLAVLGVLRAAGAGADIVSGGELARVHRAGFPAEHVVFSGVGKTAGELRHAVRAGVGLINVESFGELRLLDEIACAEGRVARCGIRVNPGVTAETHPYTMTGAKGMKFGVPLDEVPTLAAWAAERSSLCLVSIGMHVGSQILAAEHFREGAEKLGGLVAALREAGIESLEIVGVGGGIGIRYTDERPVTPEAFAEAVRPLATATALPLAIEPGRSVVGPAGALLTRVLYRKHSGSKDFVIVDAGMSELVRPALYKAVHRMEIVTGREAAAPDGSVVDVVGPICETGDFLGLERELPGAEPGALLAVHDVGAYGFSMSSTYNSRPRAAEVLRDGERWAVVRERETIDDLMRGEWTVEGLEWQR